MVFCFTFHGLTLCYFDHVIVTSFCYRKLTLAESNIVSVSRQQNSDGLGTLLPPSEPARVPTSFERNR